MGKMTRRALIGGGAALAIGGAYGWHRFRARPSAAALGFELAEDERAAALDLLGRYPAVDVHAHPGRTFTRGASGIPPLLQAYKVQSGFESRTIGDMVRGQLSAACFAAVSDFNVLDLSKENGLSVRRPFKDGEAWRSYQLQIQNLKKLATRGLVTEALVPDDLLVARAASLPAAIWSVEGGDFLEGSVERLRLAYADGVRSVTLVHYRTNELADTMTVTPEHGGLTSAGEAIVSEMNQLGMVIDLAHMSEAGALRAMEVSSRPVMFSHTHVSNGDHGHPRFITPETANVLVENGGVIGAWPAGIGISDLAGYADRILALIDMVGIEHVSLGTDMDANYKPVFDNYARLPDLVGLLTRKGMQDAELGLVLGGNFLRVWGESDAGKVAAP